jgi:photosystem II stability/assembly factor-like uncharacterized protein
MTPEERDLRRALNARSGHVSPEFESRLSAALAEDRPASRLIPALALVAAVLLVFASVGVLLLARQARNLPQPITAGSTPTPTPTPVYIGGVLTKPRTPIALPATAQVSAASNNVVWALMVNKYLYRSTDRGTTWEQRPLPASPGGLFPPVEISFVSGQEGWLTTPAAVTSALGACVDEQDAVWHTTDAGLTWQSLGSSAFANTRCNLGLSFVDPSRGFLGAWDPNHAPVIYRTTDGGLKWAASTPLPDPPGFKTRAGSTLHPGRVRAFGSTLLVPVWQQTGSGVQYVYRSTDGGATWAYVATAPGQDGSVDFVTSTHWLKLIGPGQSTDTGDAGATWRPYASDYSQSAPIAADFVFADSLVGYGTVRGGITRTVDGGLHWTAIETPGTGMKACC